MIVAAAIVPEGRRGGRQEAHLPRGRCHRRRRGRRRSPSLPASVPAIGIACFGVLGFGLGVINTLIFALQADTVDYGEWKSGVRAEGGSYSVLSFTRKAGQGIGGARRGLHDRDRRLRLRRGDAERAAVTSIRVAAGIVPAVCPGRGGGHARLPTDREGLPGAWSPSWPSAVRHSASPAPA